MKPMDFLTGINDIDDGLLQSSLELLQEDSMDKKIIRKGGLTLSKMILVAVIAAGILGVTAFAAELFPSIFGRLNEAHIVRYVHSGPVTFQMEEQRDAFHEKAIAANQNFEPIVIPLPELHDSKITIGETYYDGKSLMIAYRLEEEIPPASFDFGPDSPEYEKLRPNSPAPGRNNTLDDCLERGFWNQQRYDCCKAFLKKFDIENVQRASSFNALDQEVSLHLSDEEWDRVCDELRETGHVGLTYRQTQLADDLYGADGSPLSRNGVGRSWCFFKTEWGDCFECIDLPEKLRDQDTLTVYLKFKSTDEFHYIDAEKGAKKVSVPAGEALVPVILTLADQ